MQLQVITVLGSTGSIGVQALDVIEQYPQYFSIFALTAYNNIDVLLNQCQQFQPQYAVVVDKVVAAKLAQRLKAAQINTTVLAGEDSLLHVVAASKVDVVLSAIVGAAALVPTMSAITAGKRILLANKESLVMAGELMMSAIQKHQATLLPIDSEHNAIFQCLPSYFLPGQVCPKEVHSIVLTASGGPFRLTPTKALATVTLEQAIAHPNWSMGAKISVDSATMMNKGLEVIEAHWLFSMPLETIDILIHPQSLLHAFVRYQEGSVLTHLASHDMRVPIAHALAWPDRINSGVAPLDLTTLSGAEFYYPDLQHYPCLSLAYQALKAGGSAATILNAANEIAVNAFLSNKLRFDRIASVIEETLEQIPTERVHSLDDILRVDNEARSQAIKIIERINTMDHRKAAV